MDGSRGQEMVGEGKKESVVMPPRDATDGALLSPSRPDRDSKVLALRQIVRALKAARGKRSARARAQSSTAPKSSAPGATAITPDDRLRRRYIYLI